MSFPSPATPTLYAVLGVSPNVSQSELSRQYKRLALQLHPDRAAYRSGTDEPAVRAKYQSVVEAYEVLSDPERRASYDFRCGVNFSLRVAALRAALAKDAAAPAPSPSPSPKRHRAEAPVPSEEGATAEGQSQSCRNNSDDDDDDDDEYQP
ncbi:DnaJ domain [Trypanosoma vivax]|nr:putative chaperone [Trypanosoma vivax]KAH8609549.1 DnaJ domain [Trypanosoma vivax]